MAYTIVELQTDANGNTATPANKTEKDRNMAISKWHETCALAAISNVYMHVVLLIGERGDLVDRGEFTHDPTPSSE